MLSKIRITIFIFLTLCQFMYAQNVGINTTGAAPSTSAMLDIVSSSKGLLLPRVSLISNTDVATILAPATSLLVYNTNTSMTNGNGTGYYYWDGSKWNPIALTSNSGGPCSPSQITNELDAYANPCTGACTGSDIFARQCAVNCSNLSFNSYTDWRAPSVEELLNLTPIALNNTNNTYVWTVSPADADDAATAGAMFLVNLSNFSNDTGTNSTIAKCRCVR